MFQITNNQITTKSRQRTVSLDDIRKINRDSVADNSSQISSFAEARKDGHFQNTRTIKQYFEERRKSTIAAFHRGSSRSVRESREKSCAILVPIVSLFIITHSFRLAFKVYEAIMPNTSTSDNYDRCFKIGR